MIKYWCWIKWFMKYMRNFSVMNNLINNMMIYLIWKLIINYFMMIKLIYAI